MEQLPESRGTHGLPQGASRARRCSRIASTARPSPPTTADGRSTARKRETSSFTAGRGASGWKSPFPARQPAAFSTRQIFEIYNGPRGTALRSYLKNGTDKELTINASDVLGLNLPDRPHTLSFVERIFTWRQTRGGLRRGGRNGIVRYDSGDGWFCVPENNWATSLVEGQNNADPTEKFLGLDIFPRGCGLRVAANPKAVQLTLFPREEIEWFSVNLGVFSGDLWDGRHGRGRALAAAVQVPRSVPRPFRQRLPLAAKMERRRLPEHRHPQGGRGRLRFRPLRRGMVHRGRHGRRESLDRHGLALRRNRRAGNDAGALVPPPGQGRLLRPLLVRRPWPRRRRSGQHRLQTQANRRRPHRQIPQRLGPARLRPALANRQAHRLFASRRFGLPQAPGHAPLHQRRHAQTPRLPDAHHLRDRQPGPYLVRPERGPRAPGRQRRHRQFQAYGNGRRRPRLVRFFRPVSPGRRALDLGRRPEHRRRLAGFAAVVLPVSPCPPHQRLLLAGRLVGGIHRPPAGVQRLAEEPAHQGVLNEPLRPVYNGPDWLKNEGPWCWSFIDAARGRALVFAVNHRELNANNSFAAKLRGLD